MVTHFLRFSAPDAQNLLLDIERVRAQLLLAEVEGDPQRTLERSASLTGMITTNRQEKEAYHTGARHLLLARSHAQMEESAWLLHALATAAQYLNRRQEANALYAEALEAARRNGWKNLEHFVLHHWGRSRAEEGLFEQAEQCYLQALAIRVELNLPRQESTRKALAHLAELRSEQAGPLNSAASGGYTL
jgi:tetratricopeptide (TPR) repeat protein